MADCFATPLCANLQPMRIFPKGVLLMRRNLNLRSQQREFLLFGKIHHIFCLSTSKFSDVQVPSLLCAEGHRGLNDFLKCYCWGTLVDPENTAPTNLVSAMDQVLLMVSAIFAYMAGAVTQRRLDFLSDCTNEGSSSTTYARSEISENEPSSKTDAVWVEVNKKILGALNANLDNRGVIADMKGVGKRYSLSLFALNEGPTWRLLWATLRSLQKEVFDIQSSHEAVNRADWLMAVYELFKGIISQIWAKWLEEELSLGIGSCNMNLVSQMQERLKGNDIILNNIKRSGKTELYGDLLYFLKFGYLRSGCCLDTNFLVNHGVEILEDLVITLADAVACIFLELISVDSDFSAEINSLGLKICPFSTRVLQRLRNEVVLKQWLHQNFESVVCLYEDRFELFVLFREKMEDNLEIQSKRSIWQRLIFRKQAVPSTLNCIQIISISLSAKRTKELQALNGWRYYFSLFLEFTDLAMPVVKTLFDKARNVVSFFLMCMIGRSLGLIFSGIRQSLGWK